MIPFSTGLVPGKIFEDYIYTHTSILIHTHIHVYIHIYVHIHIYI